MLRRLAAVLALVILGSTRRKGPRMRTVLKACRWLEAHASEDPVRLVDFAEERMESGEGYRDAVAAPLHEELSAFRPGNVGDRHTPENRSDDLIPGRLTGLHARNGHAVREGARNRSPTDPRTSTGGCGGCAWNNPCGPRH